MSEEFVGQPIRSLQTMLRTIAQLDSSVLPAVPDGLYTADTMASVSSFQKRHGLPVTGITDLDTWYAVAAEYRRAIVELSPAEAVNPVFQPGQIIYIGERNSHLFMIHGMLQAIALYYPSLPSAPCGDLHDESSAEAVRWLQRRAGLEATGNITRETWRYLARLYRTAVGDGTQIPPASRSEQSSPAAVG